MRARLAALAILLSLSPLMPIASGCGDCTLTIDSTTLPPAVVGVLYQFQLDSDCGGDTWFVQGSALPPGLSLAGSGDLVGIPTLAGVYSFTIGVSDSYSGEVAFRGFSLVVEPAA